MSRETSHPNATDAAADTRGFYCGTCGEWQGGLSWYTPTDETGDQLYHGRWSGNGDCAPSPERWWCRRGQHVVIKRCPAGAHLARQPAGARKPIACARCGETFIPARSDARYCSGRCRTAAHRSR